jgi:hypothetical protein
MTRRRNGARDVVEDLQLHNPTLAHNGVLFLDARSGLHGGRLDCDHRESPRCSSDSRGIPTNTALSVRSSSQSIRSSPKVRLCG